MRIIDDYSIFKIKSAITQQVTNKYLKKIYNKKSKDIYNYKLVNVNNGLPAYVNFHSDSMID